MDLIRLDWGWVGLDWISFALKWVQEQSHGHGCVPLDEIYLTVSLKPGNGSRESAWESPWEWGWGLAGEFAARFHIAQLRKTI